MDDISYRDFVEYIKTLVDYDLYEKYKTDFTNILNDNSNSDLTPLEKIQFENQIVSYSEANINCLVFEYDNTKDVNIREIAEKNIKDILYVFRKHIKSSCM